MSFESYQCVKLRGFSKIVRYPIERLFNLAIYIKILSTFQRLNFYSNRRDSRIRLINDMLISYDRIENDFNKLPVELNNELIIQ